ncbi:hypothetical protein GYMLUDRAFT_262561 [Collybiopsis luxurians FD-317 M1]|uniref:Uncharacterized protein n=1 Tax=Collybiopsis luxurians FD-317 M1 TaxID=944289 RepID=A0A0D0CRH4_9AGAR|nr:hypothetical protein GYMLUDRAFT_262561 [Collybiopsis luxurians FD-317 M1]
MDDQDWIQTYRYCREDADLARANQRKSQSGGITPSRTVEEPEVDQASVEQPIGRSHSVFRQTWTIKL